MKRLNRAVFAVSLAAILAANGCDKRSLLGRTESREAEKDGDRDDSDRRRPDGDRKPETEKEKDEDREAGDPDAVNPNLTPEQAREHWLEEVANPDAKKDVVLGAARFFRVSDKPLAEKLLLRGKVLDPNGPWSSELGRLYYAVLEGATSMTSGGLVGSVNLADAHGAYANEIRKKLSASTDATTLAMTAEGLGMWGRTLYENHSIDFDPVALARTYLDQALKVDPQSILAHQVALNIRFLDRGGQITSIPKGSSPEAQYQALESLPEPQRFFKLSLLAEGAYISGEQMQAAKNDSTATAAVMDTARKCAQEALLLASKFPGDTDSGTAVYDSNMVLGLLAARASDRKSAVQYMLDASKAKPTEELAYSGTDFALRLPELLYQLGERDSVAEYLERFGQGNIFERGWLLESAKAIRSGKKPLWLVK